MTELSDLSYEERLKHLDLPSLKYRRIRGNLIQIYRLVHDIDDLDQSMFITFSKNITRGDKYKIYVNRCKTNIRQNFFINGYLRIWNNLCFKTKNADCIDSFKILLDAELWPLRFVYD